MEHLNENSSPSALNKIIVALDDLDQKEIHLFLKKASSHLRTFKIGMEVFYRYGRPFLEEVHKAYGIKIFLDLKLHDIPQTVQKAVSSLNGLPIEFLTLHLTGGRTMIKQGIVACREFLPSTKVLGVTYLTSLGAEDFSELWNFQRDQTVKSFQNLVRLGQQEGIHGLVLSVHELPLVNEVMGSASSSSLLKVCPGIRFSDDPMGDQKRVATPAEAFKNGADYLVIGRSLTQSLNFEKRLQELVVD